MPERTFYTAARLSPDGSPVVLIFVPAAPNEPDFELAMGPRSARAMAAALLEIAADAEALATTTPTGPPN